MLINKVLLELFFAATAASHALPTPEVWPQRRPRCVGSNALLSIRAATGLPAGLNVAFGGFPTPTLFNEAADEISILYPVKADCRFYNANGEFVVVLPAGQTRAVVGPPQVLRTAICDPCVE